jgi:hypothetical protein
MVSRGIALAAVVLVLAAVVVTSAGGQALAPGRPAPDIAGGPWINSEPLTMPALRGRVVLVEFWTYG